MLHSSQSQSNEAKIKTTKIRSKRYSLHLNYKDCKGHRWYNFEFSADCVFFPWEILPRGKPF